ncbi:MAG: hypothetical protein FJ271_28360 [Planctomycetes bacterium]|nr:hypothetical protein [Planctomycetota bacterium]
MSRFPLPEQDRFRLPQPADPGITPEGFVGVLVPIFPGQTVEQLNGIYQQAFAKAQAVARHSILERDLLGFWN